ncbi:MAG: hypothetical protein AAGM22_09845 [Acidobacteriota bacterium]
MALLLAIPAATALASEVQSPAAADRSAERASVLSLEDVRILALDPPKRAAVLITGADGPALLEPGDLIEEVGATVTSVGSDKLVVDWMSPGAESVQIRAWIFKPEGAEPPRVLQLRPRPPARLSDRPIYAAPGAADEDAAAASEAAWEEALGVFFEAREKAQPVKPAESTDGPRRSP